MSLKTCVCSFHCQPKNFLPPIFHFSIFPYLLLKDKNMVLKYCICPDLPNQVLPSQFVFWKKTVAVSSGKNPLHVLPIWKLVKRIVSCVNQIGNQVQSEWKIMYYFDFIFAFLQRNQPKNNVLVPPCAHMFYKKITKNGIMEFLIKNDP